MHKSHTCWLKPRGGTCPEKDSWGRAGTPAKAAARKLYTVHAEWAAAQDGTVTLPSRGLEAVTTHMLGLDGAVVAAAQPM